MEAAQAIERRRVLWVLAALLALATAARLVLGLRYFGWSSGDDVEIVEEGFRRVFGLDYRPLPIRSLLLSDLLVAPALWFASAVGVRDPSRLAWLATVPFVALASVNVALVYAIGARWLAVPLGVSRSTGSRATATGIPAGTSSGVDARWAALLAAGLYAVHWIPLGYGSTVYPRTASATCLLVGVWLLSAPPGGDRWRAAAAGALGGLAFTFRYSEGVVLPPLAAMVLLRAGHVPDDGVEAGGGWRRRWAAALAFGVGFLVTVVVTVGVYDALTRGRPFASLVALVDFVLVRGETTAESAVQPWYWYLRRLPKWWPLTLVPLVAVAGRRAAGRRALLLAVLPLVPLSAIRLKGLRYLQPAIPFLCLAAAVGALVWWRAGRRRTTAGLVAASLLLAPAGLTFLREKSMAAVEAAHAVAAEGPVGCVALAQGWAYGDKLYLPEGLEVRWLPVEPDLEELVREGADCAFVGLYSDHLERVPEIAAGLARRGFESFGRFEWGRSRAVAVFRRSVAAGSEVRGGGDGAPLSPPGL